MVRPTRGTPGAGRLPDTNSRWRHALPRDRVFRPRRASYAQAPMSQQSSSTTDRPLRIAQIAPPLERVPPEAYGGTERVIDELARALTARGHEVSLFAAADSTTPVRIVPTVETPLRTRGDDRDLTSAFVVAIVRALRRQEEFDVLHAHLDAWNLPLACAATTPVVATFHGRLDRPGFGKRLA